MTSQYCKINRGSDIYEITHRTETEVTLSLVRDQYIRTVSLKAFKRLYTEIETPTILSQRPVKKGKSQMTRPAPRLQRPTHRLDLSEIDEDPDSFDWSTVEDVTMSVSEALVRCCGCHRYFDNDQISLCISHSVKVPGILHLCSSCRSSSSCVSLDQAESQYLHFHE